MNRRFACSRFQRSLRRRRAGLMQVACFALVFTIFGRSSPAVATTDAGELSRLVAVAGQRWAIVVVEALHEGCGTGGCEVFVLDRTAKKYRRRQLRRVRIPSDLDEPNDQRLLSNYIAQLSLTWARRLNHNRVSVEQLGAVKVQATSPTRLRVHASGRGRVNVELQRLWRSPSVAPFNHATKASEDPCIGDDRRPRCSTCTAATRWLNGEKHPTWSCEPELGRLEGAGKNGVACRCDAKASLYELQLKTGDRKAAGRRVLAEPFKLGQNIIYGPGITPSTELVIAPECADYTDEQVCPSDTSNSSLRAHLTADGWLLLTGGAVHAPRANGTWFAVSGAIDLGAKPAR